MKKRQNRLPALHIILWVAQVLLAGVFLLAGATKTIESMDKLSQMIPWTIDVPLGLVRFIGICEMLGAVALILPAALRIRPELTPIAAICLLVVQMFAVMFHISRGEMNMLGINIGLGFIAAFIAWGRIYFVRIEPKEEYEKHHSHTKVRHSH